MPFFRLPKISNIPGMPAPTPRPPGVPESVGYGFTAGPMPGQTITGSPQPMMGPQPSGGILRGQPTTPLGERLRTNLSTMFGKGSLPIAGQQLTNTRLPSTKMKKGGAVKKKSGGSVSSASKRADGCAIKGKTKGKIV